MTIKNQKAICWVLMILCFTSCKRFISFPGSEQKKIVLGGHTESNAFFSMNITESSLLYTPSGSLPVKIKDAVVLLYENDVFKDTIFYDYPAEKYLSNIRAEANNTYRVTVTHPGYPAVNAVSQTPSPVQIDTILLFRKISGSAANFTLRSRVKLIFTDSQMPGEKYVIVGIFQSTGVIPLSCNDPAAEAYTRTYDAGLGFGIFPEQFSANRLIILSDNTFNGKQKEIELDFDDSYFTSGGNPQSITIKLMKINNDFYKSLKIYFHQKTSSGGAFYQPLVYETNVKGGYGLFTTFTADERTVQ